MQHRISAVSRTAELDTIVFLILVAVIATLGTLLSDYPTDPITVAGVESAQSSRVVSPLVLE
jgi:hypothetical protein